MPIYKYHRGPLADIGINYTRQGMKGGDNMLLRNDFDLQWYVTAYIQKLSPALNYGRYYLQYVVRCYVEMGPDTTVAELIRQTAKNRGCTSDNVRSCIKHFTQNACTGESKDILIRRWQALGWDGRASLTASRSIPLVCKGFLPYLIRCDPKVCLKLLKAAPPTYMKTYADALDYDLSPFFE